MVKVDDSAKFVEQAFNFTKTHGDYVKWGVYRKGVVAAVGILLAAIVAYPAIMSILENGWYAGLGDNLVFLAAALAIIVLSATINFVIGYQWDAMLLTGANAAFRGNELTASQARDKGGALGLFTASLAVGVIGIIPTFLLNLVLELLGQITSYVLNWLLALTMPARMDGRGIWESIKRSFEMSTANPATTIVTLVLAGVIAIIAAILALIPAGIIGIAAYFAFQAMPLAGIVLAAAAIALVLVLLEVIHAFTIASLSALYVGINDEGKKPVEVAARKTTSKPAMLKNAKPSARKR